ncbi:hypothetical protein PC116_g21564 [Phytophthora cactorum]|uniref:Uncharacterized protein n=1 Tax=Phytophthora cactorum TaxID=29920 RepID=A0A8T1FEG8_9STRA|nr:hypothetical protein PC111_g14616 [Phytophthora cactorum]KAG2886889.1 hypothetical protein PC114_g19061 [Phytophthora cactorum]KAG2898253.1 hypothetical protein PC115_g16899 [Phytophthora cactorum]KAG2913609.1 hypothetical protein PC117_g18530 [Phytophthora cactorum]KAG2970885.1 hypothetical protein PC118_g16606 [Phytophthora cactorum]
MFDAFKSDSSNGSTAFAEVAEATTNAEVPPTTIPTAIPLNIPSPLSSKTRSKEFLEFEGATIFAPSPSPTYRYSLSLKSGMLRIWLENSESKKQWNSAFRTMLILATSSQMRLRRVLSRSFGLCS